MMLTKALWRGWLFFVVIVGVSQWFVIDVSGQNRVDTLRRGIELKELIVKSKKGKYSKKNNPAVEFVKRLRTQAVESDPLRHEYYSYRRYGRVMTAICPFDTAGVDSTGRWGFLRGHVETSPISGATMLPISVMEKLSGVYYEKGNGREIVEAVKRDGIYEFADQDGIEAYLEDVMREIDIFQDDINLLQNRLVSPLGRIAPDFYKFYLTDTVEDPSGVGRWIELSFTPRVNTTFGFHGRLYVAEGDTTMFVRKVRMGVPSNINLNFVDKLEIEVDYERGEDGSRLKTRDDFKAELKVLPSMPGIYARRLSRYSDHGFGEPDRDVKDILADEEGDVVVVAGADEVGKITGFWDGMREEEMSESAEIRIPELMSGLRSVPVYKYGEKALRIISSGYVATSSRQGESKFDFGPIYTFLSHDDLEGMRLKVGGMTMPALNRRWLAGGYMAYGMGDSRMKYNGWIEYSLIDKTKFVSEFPVRSIRVEYIDDVSFISQQMLYTENDNVFLSLRRAPDHMMLYERKASATFKYERRDHLSFTVEGYASRKSGTRYLRFEDGVGQTFTHYWQSGLDATVRWAPGEKFYESRRLRIPINYDNLELFLTHRSGVVNLGGKNCAYNRTEIGARKRFWLSAFGFIDLIGKGGHIWGGVPYPELVMPSANLSYVIQPETFALLDPMEFVADTYGQIDMSYRANGAILNRIPLLNRLRLREVLGVKVWWGKLSERNRSDRDDKLLRFPEGDIEMSMPRPYVEASVGLDNIFKLFRVDYVWRVNYRNGGRDLRGVRIAAMVKF